MRLFVAVAVAGLAALAGAAPSPPPTTAPVRDYADVALEVSSAATRVLSVERGRFARPTTLPRFRGRFEARALRGTRVLERVRFDLPLLADAETDDASDEARRFAERLRAGVTVRARVRVPLPDGADAIAIVDGKSGRTTLVALAAARPK